MPTMDLDTKQIAVVREFVGDAATTLLREEFGTKLDVNRLFKPFVLAAAANFNTLVSEGRTVVPTNAIAIACTNRPSATAGVLDVALIGGSGVFQVYRVFQFDLAYERQRLSGGTWTDWVQSASKDMVDTSAANTLQGAQDYADANALFKPVVVAGGQYTNINQVTTSGHHILTRNSIAAEISGLPEARAGFIDVLANGTMIAQIYRPSSSDYFYIRTSSAAGVFGAFAKIMGQAYADTIVAASRQRTLDDILVEGSANLFNVATVKTGFRLSNNGIVSPVAGAKCSDYIPIDGGETYTISATAKPSGVSFYADRDAVTSLLYSAITTGTQTITAPVGARLMVVNVKREADAADAVDLKVERGSVATAYVAYDAKSVLRQSTLPPNLVKSDALPENIITTANVVAASAKPYDIVTASKNLFADSNIVMDSYLTNAGDIYGTASAVGWARSGMIPVVAGQTYTLSGSRSRHGLSFFAASTDLTAISYVATAGLPLSVIAPAGANFVAFNLQSASATGWSNIQFELGATATAYVPFGASYKIDGGAIQDLPTETIGTVVGLQSALDAKLNTEDVVAASAKPYDIVTASKNLFADSNIVNNSYLNSTNGGIVNATNWIRSGMIPVVAGQTYTLSGSRSRLGLAWFAASTDTTPVAYVGTDGLPLTVIAPAGANFAVFNLQSASVTGWSNIQFELGSTATPYIPFGQAEYHIDGSYIDNVPSPTVTALGTFTGGATSQVIRGVQGADSIVHTVVINKAPTHDASRVFNWVSTSLSGQTLHTMGDDAAPYRLNETTVGANHGYARTRLTVSSHNKTFIDVGSVWVDGASKQWVLIGIDSATGLSFTARTTNTGITATSGTLTHVSGATNTTSVTWTAVSQGQWYPMLKNHVVSVTADGKPIDPASTTPVQFERLMIAQSYELMTKPVMVEWLIARTKTNTDITEYSAASNVSVSMAYVFDKYGNCTFSTDILALDTVALNTASAAVMFQQTTRLTPALDGNVFYYMPKALPLTHESVVYDFAAKANVSTFAPSARLDMTPARVESGKTLDRVVQLTDNWGYASGFLPILSASPANRPTLVARKSLQLNNSGAKIYFSAVDSGSITSMAAGDYYSAVCYRNYFRRPVVRTDSYAVCSRQGDFYFMDWHAATTDRVPLPPELHGRAFTVFEKSDSVTVLSQTATSSVAVKTTGAGYAVLQFV